MRKVVLSIRVPPELKRELSEEAEKCDRTLSRWTEQRLTHSFFVPEPEWRLITERLESERRAGNMLNTLQGVTLNALRRGLGIR